MTGFTADDLVACYRRGVFPMAEAREDDRVFLIDPERRGVIPLDSFHVSRRLARTVRRDTFEIRIDTAFDAVIEACAAPARDRAETWINGPISRLYRELFGRGLVHTVECWSGEQLVGALYGVALGGAFFGESMFSSARDASKVALVHLVGRLIIGGYRLLDAQFMTDHLTQFGAVEMTRSEYRRALAKALPLDADFYRLAPTTLAGGDASFAGEADAVGAGAGVLQAITQTS